MRAWLQKLPFDNSVVLAQAKLLQALLLGLEVTYGVIFILGMLFLGSDVFELRFLGPLVTLALFTGAAWALLRRGAFIAAAALLVALILASQIRSLLINDLTDNTFVYLGFTIPILFAGMTLGRKPMFAAVTIITIFVGATIYYRQPYEDNEQTFVGYLLVMGFFLFVADRFAVSLRQSLYITYAQKQELVVEREKLQVTLASIGDAVLVTDIRGIITFMNSVAESLTGWPIREALGQPFSKVFNIINEESRNPVESPYDKVVSTGAIVGLANHTVLIKKDGQEIPIDDSGAPIRDSDGALAGVILVFRDISERRRSEKHEAEQRQLVETLLETSLTINSTFDPAEIVKYILGALQQVLPSDFSYVMLMRPVEVVSIHGNAEHGERFKAAFKALTDPIQALSPLQIMLRTREPLLVPDTRKEVPWLEFPLGDPLPSFLGAPIIMDHETIGFIGLHSLAADFFQPDQVRRLQFFATQIATVIQNVLLDQKERELAVIQDRQRLARELHDSVTQTIFSSFVIAGTLPRLHKDLSENALLQLEKLKRLNQGALADMRTLLLELRQADVSSIPLPELIQQLVTGAMGNASIDIQFTSLGDATLPPEVHQSFYRITQETLNNMMKHAKATHVDVQLTLQAGRANLSVKDDGVGFNPDTVDAATHMGLKIMQERANAIQAKLEIKSEIEKGTEIHLSWDQSHCPVS
jgi:PAS domain S-box-containing protein